MKINILLFAYLKEVVGKPLLSLELPAAATAGHLLQAIADKYPEVAQQIEYFKVSVNGEYVPAETVLKADQEIAIIPPVSGG